MRLLHKPLHNRSGLLAVVLAKLLIPLKRRDVRVVEGARLESVCRGNSTEGSNPSLSASSHCVFLLSISHEIDETRILSANSALFAEMLRISVNDRAEMSE